MWNERKLFTLIDHSDFESEQFPECRVHFPMTRQSIWSFPSLPGAKSFVDQNRFLRLGEARLFTGLFDLVRSWAIHSEWLNRKTQQCAQELFLLLSLLDLSLPTLLLIFLKCPNLASLQGIVFDVKRCRS
jgi:hypothetical protein